MINSSMDNLSKYEIETEIDMLSKYKLHSGVHIACIAIILSLGIIGNAYVFRIYTRKPLLPGNMFLISFAILDLMFLFTILPQIPFIYFYSQPTQNKEPTPPILFVALNYTLLISYLGIMINMTIDRVWAVFRPFTYTLNWKRPFIVSSLCILLGIVLFVFTTLVEILEEAYGTFKRIVLTTFVIFTYVIIISSYTAVLLKLRKQRRLNITTPVSFTSNAGNNENCAR